MEMTTVTDEAIRAQLEKVITSTTFRGAQRAIRLLQFLVGQSLDGHASTLKEFTLGVEGLGRGPSFDPRTDSIVRVEASRLRNRLELYYAKEGAGDSVLITLPRGTYVPLLTPRPAAVSSSVNLENKGDVISKFLRHNVVSAFRSRTAMLLIIGVFVASALMVAIVLRLHPDPAPFPKSLAVLPFSTEEPTEYLADGLTEDLINNLSRLSNLRVIARSIAFSFKGRETDPIQIGKQLNVGSVVTGRFAMRDSSFSVQVEMVNAATGSQTWGERYEGKLTDILSVREKITAQIADHLNLKLSGEEQRQLTKRYTGNAEVYPLYLQGLFLSSKPTKQGIQKAIGYYKKAIAKDPQFAPAYVSLATCYELQSAQEGPGTLLQEAKVAVTRAIEIDDTLAEAHAELGFLKWIHDLDKTGAEKELDLALKLNSNSALAHFDYSRVLAETGRFDQALVEANRAIELEPLSIQTRKRLPYVLLLARRYDEAIVEYQKLIELAPDFIQTQRELGLVYEQKGMGELALLQFQKVVAMPENYASTMARADIGHEYAVSGQRSKAQQVLADLLKESEKSYVSAYDIAVIYAGLNENGQAFTWLSKAIEQRPFFIGWLTVDPRLDGLRKDRHYAELLKRAGLVT
jgi:TolB-like protein/tetratricopeptide (TPR) repeat protein